jgi:predicted PurR-regulated permease PerM
VIPVLGSGIVWAPAAIILAATGRVGAGIGLALWGLLIVGTIDNFLRPRLVGRDTKMHDLLVLLSTFGGLAMFGLVGFIIGPIVAALFLTVWDLYGAAFREILPAERAATEPDERIATGPDEKIDTGPDEKIATGPDERGTRRR